MVWYPATLLPGASTLLPDVQQLRWHELYLQYTALIEGQLETFLKEEGVPVAAMLSAATSGAAWSKCPLGGTPARLLRLLRARLAALSSLTLPRRVRLTERPATASGA